MTKEPKSYRSGGPNSKKGQFLIEALVSISILTVGMMGVLGLLAQSLHLNALVVDNYRASYLAAEGVEIVKNIIDHNNLRNIDHEYACTCSQTVVPWNSGFSNGFFEVDYTNPTLGNNIGQLSNRPLDFDPTSNLYGYNSGVPTIFSRTITIKLIGADEISVVSTVTWSDGILQNGRIDIGDTFYNWWPPLF